MKRVLFFICFLLSVTTADASVYTYGVFSDKGQFGNEGSSGLIRSLNTSRIENIVMAGDNADWWWTEDYAKVWKGFENFNFEVVAIGNHNKGYEKEIDFFKLQNEFYTIKKQGLQFIVLNSDNESNLREQGLFLYQTLREANEDDVVILVYHHPFFTVGGSHNWHEKENFQNSILPIIENFKNKVSAIINGHVHTAAVWEANGIPIIFSSSPVQSYNIKYRTYWDDRGFKVKAQHIASRSKYWLRLDIDTDSRNIWLNYVSIKENDVTCSILLNNKRIWVQENCSK